MKFAVITDQHFGARNDSVHFLDYYEKFYSETFFPKLKEEQIKFVLILGDTFDRRKYVNFYSLKRTKEMFFDPLKEMGCIVYMLAGNHDTYFKNTNSVNALREIVAQAYPFKIYDTFPKEVEFDNTTVLLTPWICDDNRKQTLEKFK